MRFALIALLSLVSISVRAEDETTYIAVGKAKTQKTSLAITSFISPKELSAAVAKVSDTVKKDLSFIDAFDLQSEGQFSSFAAGVTPGSFPFEPWAGIKTDFIFKSSTTASAKGMTIEGYLYQVNGGKNTLSKKYTASLSDSVTLGHTIANDIVKSITGEMGIFQTKIAFVCDRTGKKELYVMDFDGGNVRQITHHKSLVMTPAWSPDGTKIAYSLIAKNKKNVKNTNLYEFAFKNSQIKLLSDRQGMNSGAHYHPDGKRIALTMSFLGNPEIFVLDPATKSATRLTNAEGVDVDPNWSPDGKFVSFVSSRAGASMVYKMNADGSGVQRLTFAGSYNATPSWSPKNNKIAFAGWLDGRFDIFTMNPDGTTIERLSKGQGNNEDPSFSPDGNFLVFSSNRAGQKNIYAMSVDGTGVKRLTYGLGNCVSPRWSGNPTE